MACILAPPPPSLSSFKGLAEATSLGFVCFVVINPRVLCQPTELILGFFFFVNFSIFLPPPPPQPFILGNEPEALFSFFNVSDPDPNTVLTVNATVTEMKLDTQVAPLSVGGIL